MTNRFLYRMFSFSFISIFCITVINVSGQDTPGPALVQAIAEGTPDEIQGMINGGANINEQNSLGWTPLHAAVYFARTDIVKLLLQSQADVNIQDSAGKTPLYVAVESGQAEVVKLLISSKPNLDTTAGNGQNALSLAQTLGLKTIATALREGGATMPVQPVVSNPDPANNQRGSRRGMRRGNDLTPELNNTGINPVPENPDQPVNADPNAIQLEAEDPNSINLDPNEVKAELQKFEGLEKAVQTVANSSRIGMKQWLRTTEDNRTLLITAERTQVQDELAFIKKIADEEKAKKTSEASDKLLASRRERFNAATREIRNQTDSQAKQMRGTTTTTSRRAARGTTTTTTRSSRRGTTSAVTGDTTTGTTPPAAGTTVKTTTYAPEVQSEADTWVNANVTTVAGRLTLMDNVSTQIISEINTLKTIADDEKAAKTAASIDGLMLARQQRYDAMRKELEKLNQQGTITQPVDTVTPTTETTVPPTTRARRGR